MNLPVQLVVYKAKAKRNQTQEMKKEKITFSLFCVCYSLLVLVGFAFRFGMMVDFVRWCGIIPEGHIRYYNLYKVNFLNIVIYTI